MNSPDLQGRGPSALQLAGIGIVSAVVVAALVVIGRVHPINPAYGLFGRQYVAAVALKALLGTVVLGVAALQVLLALWIYRRLPLTSLRVAVLLVYTRRLPGWVLPAAGGTLAVVVVVLWYTSAVWYYHGY